MDRDEGGGRVALVTGGASGIGLATAEMLARRGWRVVISDLDQARCEAAAGPIGAAAVAFDVVDEAATEAAFARIQADHGPVEALVANAGLIQPGGRPEDLPLADFDRVIAVNFRGVYISCLAAGRRMAPLGRGGIVIIGSVTASRTAPLHAYAPSKAAVVHLAACLAAEWGGPACGSTRYRRATSRRRRCRPRSTAACAIPRLITEGAALGRMVKADEIGRAVAFLLSEDAAAITGINLPVDAGWLAGAHLSTYGGMRAAR